jgi:hypothetical protein
MQTPREGWHPRCCQTHTGEHTILYGGQIIRKIQIVGEGQIADICGDRIVLQDYIASED